MNARHVIVILLLALLGTAFVTLFSDFQPADTLNRTAQYYADNTVSDTGAQNIVTAIIVTYRGSGHLRRGHRSISDSGYRQPCFETLARQQGE
ncbi:hypothetical protein [uncultured Cohaesibacter sp.]|uniref:hypothetical protein n=1 Tax=uncultured Cohaesibacter sp. TaxID=1002546 RepID=UPI002931BB4F|nr:hypothetical protein [uncultured Cohaesibacter sp.]